VEVSESVHSLCWKQAVENLIEGCKAMNGANPSGFSRSVPFTRAVKRWSDASERGCSSDT
jgi:hypothetical protein